MLTMSLAEAFKRGVPQELAPAASTSVDLDAQVQPPHTQTTGKFSLILLGMLMFLPYVCTVKYPPSPSFWGEWIALVLTCAWLSTLPRRASAGFLPAPMAVPVAVVGCAVYGAALLLQLALERPIFRGVALVSIGALLLAALVCLAGARIRAANQRTEVLDVIARAVLVAFVLNVLAVWGERQGLHVYIYQLGWRAVPERAEGLIGQPNQLAVFSALACACATYFWMRGRFSWPAHLLVSLMAAFVIGATGSRAGVIALFLGTGLGAWVVRNDARRFQGWALLLALLILTGIAEVAFPVIDATQTTGALAVSRGLNVGRLELWRDSWQLIKLHPLAGVGPGNFMAARWTELTSSLVEANANHAHNLPLQLAVELGVPLALGVIIPIFYGLWHCVRGFMRSDVRPEHYLIGTVALILGVYAMLEYPLSHIFFLVPFALMMGLVEQPDLPVKVSLLPRTLRSVGWVIAAAFCVGVAMDYHRVESLYTKLDYDMRTSAKEEGGQVRIAIQDSVAIQLFSLFDVYANLMYARTLHADGFMMDYKIPINERAMLTMTNQETIGRQVAFLAVAGQDQEARALLARTRRGVNLEALTRGVLQVLAKDGDPRLKAFVASLPPQAEATAAP